MQHRATRPLRRAHSAPTKGPGKTARHDSAPMVAVTRTRRMVPKTRKRDGSRRAPWSCISRGSDTSSATLRRRRFCHARVVHVYCLVCIECGQPFAARRTHARTCSRACRQRRWRAAHPTPVPPLSEDDRRLLINAGVDVDAL
jgi:hypothetical protein